MRIQSEINAAGGVSARSQHERRASVNGNGHDARVSVDIYHETTEHFAKAFIAAKEAGLSVNRQVWYVDTVGDYDDIVTSAYFRIDLPHVTIIHRDPQKLFYPGEEPETHEKIDLETVAAWDAQLKALS